MGRWVMVEICSKILIELAIQPSHLSSYVCVYAQPVCSDDNSTRERSRTEPFRFSLMVCVLCTVAI